MTGHLLLTFHDYMTKVNNHVPVLATTLEKLETLKEETSGEFSRSLLQ